MPHPSLLTRRNALWLGSGVLAGTTALNQRWLSQLITDHQDHDVPSRTFPIATTTSLTQRAIAKGILYGTACRYSDLLGNPDYAAAIKQQCGVLVPEWELKWSAGSVALRPTPDQFDFTIADWVANFAKNHQLLMRGHALVWHLSLPDWFPEIVTAQNAEAYLVNHVQTVARRYAGQIHSWDVVNEAVEPYDDRPDRLRRTPWLDYLGTEYIDLAFRVAAEADPNALLIYNDYGLEYDTNEDEARRTAVLNLLERLKTKGTPIHGLGIQSHLDAHETRFHAEKFRQFLADVASLDLKILVTELDVADSYLPADIEVRDRIVAAAYEDYLNVVLDEPAVIAVLTWGLSDRYTWLSEFEPRSDGLPVRPLPLDNNMNRKLAWNAIARAFDNARNR